MTEACFECCSRQWVHQFARVGGQPSPFPAVCPRCNGTGWDPESERWNHETPVVKS